MIETNINYMTWLWDFLEQLQFRIFLRKGRNDVLFVVFAYRSSGCFTSKRHFKCNNFANLSFVFASRTVEMEWNSIAVLTYHISSHSHARTHTRVTQLTRTSWIRFCFSVIWFIFSHIFKEHCKKCMLKTRYVLLLHLVSALTAYKKNEKA